MGKRSAKQESANRNIRLVAAGISIVVVLIAVGIVIRPGVFVVQPSVAYPDGVTILYHSRGQDMDFFSSPDGICIKLQGSATAACRDLVISEMDEVLNRAIVRLPYSDWAHRQSLP